MEFQSQDNKIKSNGRIRVLNEEKAEALLLKQGTLCSQEYLSGCLEGQEAIRPKWTDFLQCQIYSMASNLKHSISTKHGVKCKFSRILKIKLSFQNNSSFQ